MNEYYARERLVDICKLMYDRQLITSTGGNVSIRIKDSEILITPSGKNKGMLEPEDMVLLDTNGTILSNGSPSIEYKFHIALYNANVDTSAIIHCHPLYCTIIAIMGKEIKCNTTPEGAIMLGNVPMVKYYTPGSQELVDAILQNNKANAMIMERHGALTQGRTIDEAYNRMEELEFQAHMQVILGDVDNLPIEEIKKILRM